MFPDYLRINDPSVGFHIKPKAVLTLVRPILVFYKSYIPY